MAAGCVAAIKPLIFFKKVAKHVEIYIEIPSASADSQLTRSNCLSSLPSNSRGV